jgi:hypothetical protein
MVAAGAGPGFGRGRFVPVALAAIADRHQGEVHALEALPVRWAGGGGGGA